MKTKEGKHMAFVGGGGKSTVIRKLAERLSETGKIVIITTTTHIYRPFDTVVAETEEELETALMQNKIVTVGKSCPFGEQKKSELTKDKDKLTKPEDDFFQRLGQYADFVLTEADGAKGKPIKAPRHHEPAIPNDADMVVAVVGMDCVGKSLKDACFAYEKAEELLSMVLNRKIDEEHIITEEDVAVILSSEAGLKKNLGERDFKVVLNKADTDKSRKQAVNIKKILKEKGITDCYITTQGELRANSFPTVADMEVNHMKRVYIRGAGDLATGIGCRLYESGFTVMMTELPVPTTVRRTAAFSPAVYEAEAIVEGIKAVCCAETEEMNQALDKKEIPIVVDKNQEFFNAFKPNIVVDAIVAKKNIATKIDDAKIVIAIGPGFTAGEDCHAVIESMRGHNLGRCIYEGCAEPNTGVPGEVGGFTGERIIRADGEGIFRSTVIIGDMVLTGQVVASVGDIPVRAQIDGMVRGLLQDGVQVHNGMKAGDIDPRCKLENCFTVSDKARAIGGGVLEAILHLALREE